MVFLTEKTCAECAECVECVECVECAVRSGFSYNIQVYLLFKGLNTHTQVSESFKGLVPCLLRTFQLKNNNPKSDGHLL
jgi:hypothetical protein